MENTITLELRIQGQSAESPPTINVQHKQLAQALSTFATAIGAAQGRGPGKPLLVQLMRDGAELHRGTVPEHAVEPLKAAFGRLGPEKETLLKSSGTAKG
jgi:hypothetical protein